MPQPGRPETGLPGKPYYFFPWCGTEHWRGPDVNKQQQKT